MSLVNNYPVMWHLCCFKLNFEAALFVSSLPLIDAEEPAFPKISGYHEFLLLSNGIDGEEAHGEKRNFFLIYSHVKIIFRNKR